MKTVRTRLNPIAVFLSDMRILAFGLVFIPWWMTCEIAAGRWHEPHRP